MECTSDRQRNDLRLVAGFQLSFQLPSNAAGSDGPQEFNAEQDGFGHADAYDDERGRYRGLVLHRATAWLRSPTRSSPSSQTAASRSRSPSRSRQHAEGFDETTHRNVTENANTLGFGHHEFE
jgi:hypothetical protein